MANEIPKTPGKTMAPGYDNLDYEMLSTSPQHALTASLTDRIYKFDSEKI